MTPEERAAYFDAEYAKVERLVDWTLATFPDDEIDWNVDARDAARITRSMDAHRGEVEI